MKSGSLKPSYVHTPLPYRKFLDSYYCSNPEMPITDKNLRFPMEKFQQAFATGDFKGDMLIDIGVGSIVYHTVTAINYFRHIMLLKPTDHSVVEVKKWLDSRTGAFDSSHTSAPAMELAGTSDQEDKEIGRKTANINVAKFDLSKENLTDPLVLPQADCLVINIVLGVISKNLDEMGANLGRFTKLLKPGGHLLYCGYLNATYYGIGGERFEAAKYNESDLERILSKEGYVIINIEVSKAKAKSEVSDFDSVVFCTARKKQTP